MLPLLGITEKDTIATLLQHSVAVDSLSQYWTSHGDHEPGLVIGYATPPEHAYTPAVEALVNALKLAST